MLSFLCSDKVIEKSLVIWSFHKPFKRILETIFPIFSLWTQSEFTCFRGKVPPPSTFMYVPPLSPGYSVPPNNWAKVDTLSQATVSHPTAQLRRPPHKKPVFLVTRPTPLFYRQPKTFFQCMNKKIDILVFSVHFHCLEYSRRSFPPFPPIVSRHFLILRVRLAQEKGEQRKIWETDLCSESFLSLVLSNFKFYYLLEQSIKTIFVWIKVSFFTENRHLF